MSDRHSPATVFFDFKRHAGKVYIDLATRTTNRLLTPEEALKIVEIPEGFTLAPHPDFPGRAAFTTAHNKGTKMVRDMEDAGFRVSAEDEETRKRQAEEAAKAAAEKAAAEAEAAALVEKIVNGTATEDEIMSVVVMMASGQMTEAQATQVMEALASRTPDEAACEPPETGSTAPQQG